MNQIARIEQPGRLPAFSTAQIGLIKRTVAADLTGDEFDMFIAIANRAGLDPFRKQIYALVYNKKDQEKRKVSFITGIDGFRAIANRAGDYRPDEEAPRVVFEPGLKNADTNPLGIDYAEVTVWKYGPDQQWHKITGRAYWEEYAPLKDEWAFDEAAGKRKPTGAVKLDSGGNWTRMPKTMIAKCAEAIALRRGWPEDLAGLYEAAEMDRATIIDVTPSEAASQEETNRRMARIGGDAILAAFHESEGLMSVPVGQFADRVLSFLKACPNAATLAWWRSYNVEGLKQFWGKSPGDALELKKAIEAAAERLAMAAE